MNNENNDPKNSFSWSFVVLGFGFLIMGISYLMKGIEAYRLGEMVPPIGKSWYMSGPQAMFGGGIMMLTGCGFMAVEGIKEYKRRQRKHVQNP